MIKTRADLAAAMQGRRVLVTGHTGFKGAWLTAWLSRLGAQVAGLALAPDPQQQLLYDLAGQVTTLENELLVDVRDQTAVDGMFNSFAPELVFHLAAQPLVRRSYDEPVETFDVNVRGTGVVLDAVRRFGTQAVVCITTDKCYENVEQMWPYRETDRMGGWDPYSASKGAAELLVQSFRRSFFADGTSACASARAGNVVGGGDLSQDRLVPDVYRAMEHGTPVVLRRPDATRPWQHVLESLHGYLILGAKLLANGQDFAEAWNFGPEPAERTTVLDFVGQLAAALGPDGPTVEVKVDGPHEASLLSLDITKARDRLGWRPLLTMAERVELTAAWMRAQHADSLTSALLSDQIDWFEQRWQR